MSDATIEIGKSDMIGSPPALPEPVLEKHYAAMTWTDREMDELRRTRCLCLRCDHMHFNAAGEQLDNHCPFAATLFAVCKAADMATMITRCGYYRPKVLAT